MNKPELKTVEELSNIFIEFYFYPDIQAKGENDESEDMKSFIRNFLNGDVLPIIKLHVEAALKEASEKACIKSAKDGFLEIDKQSIINAYDLNLIK